MDPSQRHEATSFTATKSTTSPSPTSNRSTDHLNHRSMVVTPVPFSSGVSSSSLLSPDPSARSVCQPHPTPRRTTSSNSLRDENRRSSTSLNKRSSTASLRSAHSSGGPSSPRSPTFATSPTTATMGPKKPSSLEQLAPTAASVAGDHFVREVDRHNSTDLQSQTLVVVHDACYGHRFSRPRSSRAALNSIVERPERIQAGVLGVSAAYVRLAHRYAGGRFPPHPNLDVQQLPVPPFQIRKTARSMALTSPAVTHVHGSKWMDDLKSMCDAAESRLALNGKELVRPRSSGKDSTTANDTPFHEGDLYLCSESRDALEGALGGVCEGIDAVFGPSATKRTFVCIRPPGHHCSSDHPSGFCWINNVHVGISYAAMTHGLTHAAILDFDLHHGDGSQAITWEQNRKAVTAPRNAASYRKAMTGYFSLHDINSYPCEMGDLDKVRNASVCIDKAHGQSIWNVHLEPWKSNLEFWDLYAKKYTVLIEKARAFLRMHTERLNSLPNGPPPKAAIFISAGFDASEWEGSGMQRHQANVPTDFYARFTADVVRMAEEEGLGVDGRVISVLEGGYSNRALTSGVLSHLSALGDTRLNARENEDEQIDRLASEMTDRLGLYDTGPTNAQSSAFEAAYDSGWWSPVVLEELEALVYPPPITTTKREKSAPTYFAPTQSYSAKVVTPPRDRKSTGSQASEPEAPPLPPLPPVSWATAAHELSKILIPTARQINSCRPEDLNAEASRLRRERQNVNVVEKPPSAPATPEESRMKLRTRKPKASLPSTPKAETPKRATLKDNNRRTTIDRVSSLPDPSTRKSPEARTTRRKSTNATSTSTPEPDAHPSSRPPSRISPTGEGNAGLDRDAAAAPGPRRPSSSRSGTPKRPTSPKTAPPVPRVPSNYLPPTSKDEGEATPIAPSSNETAPPAGDVDSLTAGVRKLNIKLKVPSPEEHAAREQLRTAKGTSRGPMPPKRTSSKDLHIATSKASSRGSGSSRGLFSNPSTHQDAGSGVKQETRPSSSPLVSPDTTPAPTAPQVPSTGSAIPPPIIPGPIPENIRLHNTTYSAPVSTAPTRNGLPIFTSNSPIPFA
ncbi:Arginase/deacetylase, partial [Aspergillus campestris IBT 28561]